MRQPRIARVGRRVTRQPTRRDPIGRPVIRFPPPTLAVACVARSPKQATGRTHVATLPGGAKLELAEIPAGSFCMGSETGAPDEKPLHKVTIKQNFYIGK